MAKLKSLLRLGSDSRIRSLYIVHIAMLIMALGNSIIFTGVWPYLRLLDRSVTLEEYGFVVAADALAQMIFSPIFGLISDKLGSIRLVSIICAVTFFLGNLLYANIAVVPADWLGVEKARMWTMIVARFVVGIGTAINAAARSYVSKATNDEERTTHIALLSLFQTLGFVLGPAIQASLTPLGEEVVISKDSVFFTDMYTATGWVSASTGVLALCMFMPFVFVEHSANDKMDKKSDKKEAEAEAEEDGRDDIMSPPPPLPKKNPRELLKQFSTISVVDGTLLKTFEEEEKEENKSSKFPNVLATLTSSYNFFCFLFNFVLLETIMTPMAIDQWGWSEEDAILYLGITMVCGGILSGLCFAMIGPLSKMFDERLLLLFAGIVPMIIGRIIMFPMFGTDYPVTPFKNITDDTFSYDDRAAIDGLAACKYDWCDEIRRVSVAQFMIGYVFALLGYPFCVALTGSLFSKVLGPIPQGFWMGVLTLSGSLARVVGPIFVSFIYQEFGTWLLFGLVAASLGLSFILTFIALPYLVPHDLQPEERFGSAGFWSHYRFQNKKKKPRSTHFSTSEATVIAAPVRNTTVKR